MKSLYKKEDYNYMASSRRNAFMRIARELGKEHIVTTMIGSLAWGRHKAEQGVDGNLHTAIREVSFMDGYFDCLNLWCRDNDKEAQKVLLKYYPMKYESIK